MSVEQTPASQDGRTVADLSELARLIRYYILTMSTEAGSGHPTSSLSATELMTGLLFGGGFRYDLANPQHPNNDRIIFSKGHASPLFYAMWACASGTGAPTRAAGVGTHPPTREELMTYRQFNSTLEGHPTPRFRYADAATGSLGQGLSIGLGMALNAKHLDDLPYRTYVLLGDSEMAEGANWEALQIAAHYRLDNLTGILDVNRLGQRGATMYEHDLEAHRQRIAAFGWHTILIDGHDLEQVVHAYERARKEPDRPTMIIAHTVKGKGVPMLEDQNGWHGKALDQEQLAEALAALGPVDETARGRIAPPENGARAGKPAVSVTAAVQPMPDYTGKSVATRDAFGTALKRLYSAYPDIVSLDGEVSNSTKAETFAEAHPDRFFEMFIAEQNMVGTAQGLAARGKIVFVSTFAAFLTRAADQIRMAQYSRANLKFIGSHAGVSIGADGPSQMGLEDIAMFRNVADSVVLHPADAVSTERLIEVMSEHEGISYLRSLREKTPVLYDQDEEFYIGGSKVLRRSKHDVCTVVAAGYTVHEALKAADALQQEDIHIRVIDMYSIKPVDHETLDLAARETGAIITVEDHHPEGGLGEAVLQAIATHPVPVHMLAVRQIPRSGKPEELLDFEQISAAAIIEQVRQLGAEAVQ